MKKILISLMVLVALTFGCKTMETLGIKSLDIKSDTLGEVGIDREGNVTIDLLGDSAKAPKTFEKYISMVKEYGEKHVQDTKEVDDHYVLRATEELMEEDGTTAIYQYRVVYGYLNALGAGKRQVPEGWFLQIYSDVAYVKDGVVKLILNIIYVDHAPIDGKIVIAIARMKGGPWYEVDVGEATGIVYGGMFETIYDIIMKSAV